MHNPSPETLKHLKLMVMHVQAFPRSVTFGGWNKVGLEPESDRIEPYTADRKSYAYHFFSDASASNPEANHRAISGGIGMLAGGAIQARSSRLHLASPNSYASEAVSAGDNLNVVVPVNGVLQELRIRQGTPTPFYLDSASTVLVSEDNGSVKKCVWLARRVAVLHDACSEQHREIVPVFIPERRMVADGFTKYLVQAVWMRHIRYLLNFDQTHQPSP